MSIRFNCPRCDNLIAFEDKYAGKQAHCVNCGQHFIIPARSFEKAEIIEFESEAEEPEPGFYRALFVDSWKLFFQARNLTTLVFITAAVCFKFFLYSEFCCRFVSFFVVWAWLFGFYLNLIEESAFGDTKLPEIVLGKGAEFMVNIVRPVLVFLLTFLSIEIPAIVSLALLKDRGVTFMNMWRLEAGIHLVPLLLFLVSLFFFPMAILTTAIGRDITLLRPDHLLKPVFKAFAPYLTVFILLVVFAAVESQTRQYEPEAGQAAIAYLALNVSIQVIAIFVMRAIGLFYRHYNCYIEF